MNGAYLAGQRFASQQPERGIGSVSRVGMGDWQNAKLMLMGCSSMGMGMGILAMSAHCFFFSFLFGFFFFLPNQLLSPQATKMTQGANQINLIIV